jgi:hypothetical protein
MRGARLLALVLGLGAAPSLLAQSLPFAGRWLLDKGQESPGAYTVLSIKDETLRWSGPDKARPVCEQAFMLKPERPGTLYVDGRGTKFIAGMKGSIPTYLLQLRSSSCGRTGEDTRIRYPLIYDTQHIEVIEYVNGRPVGARRFHRKK